MRDPLNSNFWPTTFFFPFFFTGFGIHWVSFFFFSFFYWFVYSVLFFFFFLFSLVPRLTKLSEKKKKKKKKKPRPNSQPRRKKKKAALWQAWALQIVWKIVSDGNWVMKANGCEKLSDENWVTKFCWPNRLLNAIFFFWEELKCRLLKILSIIS